MEEKKFVQLKKDELNVKEFVKRNLGKGRISSVGIEYTPIGEKIIISTTMPGYVIGRRGEKISELTRVLKRQFKLENPNIEILEIQKPEFDAQSVADEIAMMLERLGSLKFKIIAYRMVDKIMKAGALGVELRLSGKLPSERAKSWRFASGYLKKTGDTAKIVNRAGAVARTRMGVIGVKAAILPADAKIHDRIIIDDELKNQIKMPLFVSDVEEKPAKKTKRKKRVKEIPAEIVEVIEK
ncbi:MAG: 30S ribosomal protein S3 [Nanoarchaeota archaeon]|nr:30S ribosomal protein S3 [Nanoarchaeota archaeon]MBU4086582.1 30S ribosomal protein S3 [Nanoarchaeota archaeon]